MSNKPKIYASCKAGCQWETVHRSEFEEIAALIRQYPQEDGSFLLEVGKEYKAVDKQINSSFSVTLDAVVEHRNGVILEYTLLDIPQNPDMFSNTFTVKVLGLADVDGVTSIIYEFCGVRYSYPTPNIIGILELHLDWGGELYIYNANATIIAKSAYEIAVDNGFEGTEQEWLDSLKGVTKTDKAEIVAETVDSIAVIYPEAHVIYGDVTDDNTIIIHGTLPAGEYTLKYEGEDGISTGITTIEVRAKTYTNALPSAIDSDGTPYNGGKGYKTGYRLNSSATETANEGSCVTGFIPIKSGDTVYLDNIVMNPTGANANVLYVYLYKSSFATNGAYFRADVSLEYALENGGVVIGNNGNIVQMKIDGTMFSNWEDFDNTQTAYLRFTAHEINENSVVSINKPIV